MTHDWGVSIPPDVPTETVFEIRDKLRAGTVRVELPAELRGHEKAGQWVSEMTAQMLAAYEREALRRRS